MAMAFRPTGITRTGRLHKTMSPVGWIVFASAAVPLLAGIWANRRTSLVHSMVWAGLAWLGWGTALGTGERAWCYGALCLTGCAGVAVLGARQPGVTVWNFVVI